MIRRQVDIQQLKQWVAQFPATALLGARQCGKTTLAQELRAEHYFDLENPRDLARFDNPQLALEDLKGLIAIDESD